MRAARELGSAYLSRVRLYQADAFLTLVYWSTVVPVALLLRLLRRRLLPDGFGSGRTHWIRREPILPDRDWSSRQF